MTGTEVVYDDNLGEYSLVTHCKGADLKRSRKTKR